MVAAPRSGVNETVSLVDIVANVVPSPYWLIMSETSDGWIVYTAFKENPQDDAAVFIQHPEGDPKLVAGFSTGG
jgi:hypothetical protein